MHKPSKIGSIRCTAALGCYRKEHLAAIPLAKERMDFLDSISVVRPAEIEEDAWVAPRVEDVLRNRANFRIRRGSKFASVEKCAEELSLLDEMIAEHTDMMIKARNTLVRLVGTKTAFAACAEVEKANFAGGDPIQIL